MIKNILKLNETNHKIRMIQRFFKYLPDRMYDDLDEVLDDYYYLCRLSYRLHKKGVNINEIQ